MTILVVVIILVALAFDFINGFHDAANSIATVVSTRVLTPGQAVLIVQGARQLKEMLEHYTDVEAKAKAIKDTEHRADEVTRDIYRALNSSFITPFDREDIHALASALDDILDEIEGVSSRMVLLSISRPTEEEIRLAGILVQAAEEIEKAVGNLTHLEGVQEFCQRVKRLEHEADEISRGMIKRLFDKEEDVKELIKWKELYARLEETADRCEDVANIIEGIVLKHA